MNGQPHGYIKFIPAKSTDNISYREGTGKSTKNTWSKSTMHMIPSQEMNTWDHNRKKKIIFLRKHFWLISYAIFWNVHFHLYTIFLKKV